jgi:pyrroloquinoline quinone biosynthesis protein B
VTGIRIRILGTAAGGGLPQWNCACAECARARDGGSSAWRTQDGLAVGDAGGWYLFNASPDIRTQILGTPELTPGPGRRQSPVRGILLTDAELDHTLGLVALREGTSLEIHGTAPVLDALDTGFPVRRLLEPYAGPSWRTVVPGQALRLGDGLAVTAVPLGAKRPRYAAHLPARADWVIGYRIEDRRTGGVLLYAPCLAQWSDALETACEGAQCVILDGTFYRDDEMALATGGGPTARAMGHLPIHGPGGSLERLRRHSGARRLYTHLNNTNPVADPGSPERSELDRTGVEVATDGQLLEM